MAGLHENAAPLMGDVKRVHLRGPLMGDVKGALDALVYVEFAPRICRTCILSVQYVATACPKDFL